MKYDNELRTFDCDPTLNDSQVLQFCREGYLMLPGVVPDEFNRLTCDYLEGKIPANPSWIPEGMTEKDLERIRESHEPSTIFLEDWFVEHVLLNPEVTGAVRSLLGKNVGLPVLASHHGVECPQEAQNWHHDADHVFGPELNFVEVFYFPQDTTVELGPTEIVPSTHIRNSQDKEPANVWWDWPIVVSDGPAGTLGIHHQSIMHRRGASTATGLRHMLKYSYWRTSAPKRDWITESDFDLHTAYFGGHTLARYVAHMYYWLCGKGDDFRVVGGQGWPWRTENQIGPSYGFGVTEGYLPDWRGNHLDGYTQ